MKLHEVADRDARLKEIFTKAFDLAVEKYKDDFDGDKATLAKEKLLTRFNPYTTKMEIEAALKAVGVGREGTSTAREIAQVVITNAQRLDRA